MKAKVLDELARRLHHLPPADKLVQPALSVGEQAVKVLVGILFTFAVAAYWIFERERTVDLVIGFLPRPKRKTVRDTWTLIDQKLGAFVRGELVLIVFVSTLATIALRFVGEPYWLLIGIATGILEVIPVVGPLAALALAIGAGLTVSWHTAVLAGSALLVIRLLEDYLVTPRVLGGAGGLSPFSRSSRCPSRACYSVASTCCCRCRLPRSSQRSSTSRYAGSIPATPRCRP